MRDMEPLVACSCSYEGLSLETGKPGLTARHVGAATLEKSSRFGHHQLSKTSCTNWRHLGPRSFHSSLRTSAGSPSSPEDLSDGRLFTTSLSSSVLGGSASRSLSASETLLSMRP
ncbi:hypothetical protein R1flu_008746 [Riccia fluitans]|uniref:Uncharacterized protein n=1 Tax=Riccia fluitans TaxID=41844 RepID=A0ABD1YCI4_9MARC